MSAKDPRRALLLRIPDSLRPALHRIRAAERRPSTAAALRRLVLAGLATGEPPLPVDAPAAGRLVRLQLDPGARRRVDALALSFGINSAAVVLGLAARGTATMPQDTHAQPPLGSRAPASLRSRPDPAQRSDP